jgi:DNA-binding LytR/AlgR family response regulator
MSKDTLERVEKEISQLETEDQKRLLQDLPQLLKIPLDDILFLKAAEHSFDFWNNPEDSVYDNL